MLSARLHREENALKWIMLLWTSIVSFLIAISAYAWRDMLKTERVVRPYIDDIPFRPNRYRHSD
jgi:hypothetical protein